MAFSIQTNVNSLIAQENLRVNSNFQGQTIQRLTSGYRINQSGDDAAGLSIANKLRSDTAELMQGVRNANDGISQLQIIDGGMNNVSKMLDRLRTLATQSASGTFTGDRKVLNSEFQSLLSEIDRQAQSIGLNTGGSFAKNLDVYIGSGSGSQSQANGIVTLDLSKSSVDAQSLGLKGMQAVNLTSGALGATNGGTNIGASAGSNSVENIVKAATGNTMATAGHASFQFSGTGFSDAGKITASVNLSGVTDVTTLAAALNTAIQNAGNGSTSAATAFKSANIVASVHTDTAGGQELAFSSSTSAFQVQAGDQMANAMLGNVTAGVGAAVTTTVTGGATALGTTTFSGNIVKLVVTGGGLSSPVEMQVDTSGGLFTTDQAISNLKTQFGASATLQAAGLTLSQTGSTGPMSFVSATGQTFTVQATGDVQNRLGLGSFMVDGSNNADYTTLTATSAYSAAAVVTGVPTSAALEISFNGGTSTALTSIDLTAGASATAASKVSTGPITLTAQGGVDVTALNDKFSATVVNNGVSTAVTATLAHSTPATFGKVASLSVAVGTTITTGTAGTNDSFMIALDGGASKLITLTASTAFTGASLLTELNTKLDAAYTAGAVVASFDAGSGFLTFTSAKVGGGTGSSVALSAAAGAADLLVGAGANKFNIASGSANSGVNDTPRTLAAIATELQTAFGATANVSVTNGNALSIVSATKGTNSSVTINTVAADANTLLNLTPTVGTAGQNSSVADVLDNLNAQFANNATWRAADLHASAPGGFITIASANGTSFRLNALGAGAATAEDIGFGHAGTGFTAAASTSNMSTLDAFGVSNSQAQTFTAMKFGSDSQAVTFSANDATGSLETTTITLSNNGANRSGRSIDDAVAFINQQLQQSTSNPALQKIVAVKERDTVSGLEKINFVSALGKFTVGVNSTANGGGINNGVVSTIGSEAHGSASSMSVDSQAGALQSVTAIAAAIGALGSAQAAVGKGQNQLNYAVNLAQSQVSNFSAAESRIRDADVAAEAANLTKAQVLQQASMAAMAQANSAPQAVMALLRG